MANTTLANLQSDLQALVADLNNFPVNGLADLGRLVDLVHQLSAAINAATSVYNATGTTLAAKGRNLAI